MEFLAYIRVNGVTLHYMVRGKGTPLIFIHPPVLSSVNFKYQLEELSKYFTVIVFDIRGHGKSQPSEQTLTYPLIVEDIKQIMNYLNVEKAFICGYSMGGSVALEFLLTASERALGGILIGGISEILDWRLKKSISLGITFAKLGAISTLAFSIALSNSDKPNTFWELFKEGKKATQKNVEEYFRYSLTYNCTNQLKNILLPVLLVYGAKDKEFHPYGRILQATLPKNEFQLIPNVKHQIPTKTPNQLNDRIKQFVFANRFTI
jgi:pimeloyl-ACP methyl ester carboxylesterase